jgi:DNA adenine methylase
VSTKTKPMPVRALASWFGSDRTIAPLIWKELAGSKFVGVPFAGGMSVLAEIDAPSLCVNDLHSHVINLASVVSVDDMRVELIRRLDAHPFHPKVFEFAKTHCCKIESGEFVPKTIKDNLAWAVCYFIVCWMGRSAVAGTERELQGSISSRWNGNGGSSNTRYRSAVAGLDAWGKIMRRCEFRCMDAFEFLERCLESSDLPGHSIYVDAPWPDDGDKYVHKFDEPKQRRLAGVLGQFKKARVVVRFGDHPLIRELYRERVTQELFLCQKCGEEFAEGEKDYRGRHPHCGGQGDPNGMVDDGGWIWLPVDGRTQTNQAKREVLILNGPSRADGRMFQ